MANEERIQRLEDIESIRYLQAKYQRCLDSRDFDGLSECFADDAISSYGNGSMSYVGKDNILKFLMKALTLHMPSAHLIHGGEIDWVSPKFMKAKWYLEDFLLHKVFLVKLHGVAIYNCEYKKIDGNWKISSIGYERGFEYVEARGLINLFTLKKTTLLKKAKNAEPDTLGEYGKYYHKVILKDKKRK